MAESGRPEAERWARVQEVFLEAAECDDAEREALLDAACGDDIELKAEVRGLLAADERRAMLDATLDDLVLLIDDADKAPLPPPPERAGPYRILGELGRGGMGVVYRAERSDAQYTRQVALKVVGAPGVDPDELARRFARERRILARLEHPNIARLYDAGVTEDGRSWLSMELVEGTPIHHHCDERRLSVAERLGLFETVVEAVDYAHRNLVVHRDLKPSNILVTDDGTVKLLDFGIAKVLVEESATDSSGGADAADAPLTRMEQRVLTPEYASPEQLEGDPVTTASDVYALGVLLHELLTGRRPRVHPATRDLTTSPSAAVTRRGIEEGAPAADPAEVARARGTTPAKLRRRLRGDLDTLVRAALRVEPEHRYPSAAALLDDLVRLREGHPLTARRPATAYRLRKFVARNRAVVGAAGAVALSLVVATGVSWRQARIAEAERAMAESVSGFLEGLFQASNPFGGPQRLDTLPVGLMLDRAVERLDTDLADQPEVRARMQRVLGSAYQGIGATDRARVLLSEAVAAYDDLERPDDAEVGQAWTDLARVAMQSGDARAADDAYGRALSLASARFGEASREVADLRIERVGALLDLDRTDDAEAALEAGLAARRGNDGEVSPEVARHLNLLGSLEYRQGRVDEAIVTLREALEINRATQGAEHPQTSIMSQNLGLILLRAGRPAEAEPLVRTSRDALVVELGVDHPTIGLATRNLAEVVEALDRWDEAEPLYREALQRARNAQGPDGRDVGITAHAYGQALAKRNRIDEAVAHIEEALRIEIEGAGVDAPGVAALRATLDDLRARGGG